MKRREFMALVGSMAAAAPFTAAAQPAQPSAPPSPVRQDWLDRHKEPALEPELPIVDPHHHLWVRPGWRYMLDDFLADVNTGHNIVATVFVQANSMYRDSGPIEMRPVGETEFVNGMAAICASGYCGKTRFAAGIVGYADLSILVMTPLKVTGLSASNSAANAWCAHDAADHPATARPVIPINKASFVRMCFSLPR
jgi:hypothetical protein